jgi:hypothetical protein
MAVAVTSGTHTIGLTYEVAGWPATGVVSVIALALVVTLLVLDRLSRRSPDLGTSDGDALVDARVSVGVAARPRDEATS